VVGRDAPTTPALELVEVIPERGVGEEVTSEQRDRIVDA
jgi:hypothetical protein